MATGAITMTQAPGLDFVCIYHAGVVEFSIQTNRGWQYSQEIKALFQNSRNLHKVKRYKEKSDHYVVFDIETTGLSVDRGHRIIEIGAVAVKGFMMGEEFTSLVFTEKSISKGSQKVHGITKQMLAGQPEAEEVLNAFRSFIGTNTLVAHNADFDMGFLKHEYRRLGEDFTNRYKCTLKMSRKLYPGLPDYKLETVARHLGIPVDISHRHRALEDAKIAAQVWIEMGNK